MSHPEAAGNGTSALEVPTDVTAEGAFTVRSADLPLPIGQESGSAGGASPNSGTGPHS